MNNDGFAQHVGCGGVVVVDNDDDWYCMECMGKVAESEVDE